jgi:DHA3 family macrolide efflux protein-like MFS transporter
MLGGLVLLGLVNVVRGLVPPNAYWLFLVAAFVSGPPAAMFFATLKAVLQSTIPLQMQGRVFATQNSLFWAMGPLGLAIVGSLGDAIGVRTLFLLSGAMFLLVALLWALAPSVRNMEQGPPGAVQSAAAAKQLSS